ncbi:MAG: hypothetical protein FWC14_06320 [Candidatus Bathyarchaeota archaeon]|uniref:DUF6773 family protein n=1 Tax=Candidatus Bathycorpusculum sp. TaxID=2994959 RepID=UPI00281FDC36|nr:hypothetical protein [Candidatus Termiticorpusculum sp.]MCL2291766.1 hypothetical protein [Candidatus Termiticorpusculum sp.]
MELNKINDERIQKGLAQNIAPMYFILLILTTLSLIIKMTLKLHPVFYMIEIIALIVSPTYYIITNAQKNILFVKETDEAITNIKNATKNNSYNLHFWIFLIGGIILGVSQFFYPIFLEGTALQTFLSASSMLSYLFLGGIPLSVASKKSHKAGLLVAWNSEKSKTTILKKLKQYYTAQAVCSGVIIIVFCLLAIFGYSLSRPFELVFIMAIVLFGASFMYFSIKRGMLESEKYANEELDCAEKSVDDNEEDKI